MTRTPRPRLALLLLLLLGFGPLLAGRALAASPTSPGPRQDGDDRLAPDLTVRGQLVDEEGAPMVGVVPTLTGWPADDAAARRLAVPDEWAPPELPATDSEGRFEVTFAPPRAYQFRLRVAAEGHGRLTWRWTTREHDTAQLDLGRAVLRPPGIVEGHLQDLAGELLTDGWTVTAVDHVTASGLRTATSSTARVDPGTATFRIDDLPPGRVSLAAHHPDGRSTSTVVVTTTPDAPVHQVLVHRAPSLEGRIVVRVVGTSGLAPLPDGSARAISATGERVPLVRVEGFLDRWQAVGLEPGVHAIEIDDPRFEPWHQEVVRTGQEVTAVLRGSCALILRVRDPEGAPVTHAGVELLQERELGRVVTRRVVEVGGELPPDGRFSGLVPGTWWVRVTHADGTSREVRVPDLAAGEVRGLDVHLGEGGRIAGRVRDADGAPLAGVRVQRTRGNAHGHDGDPRSGYGATIQVDGESHQVVIRYRDEEVTTDAEGRYAFEGLADGPHAVRVVYGESLIQDRRVEVPTSQGSSPQGSPAEASNQDFVRPPTGSLRVRLQLPPRVNRDELSLVIEPPAPNGGASELRRPPGSPGTGSSLPDLSTHTELPVGRARVVVERLPSHARSHGRQVIHLVHAEVRPGDVTEVTCDLRESYPSDGRVRVLLEGEPRLGSEVSLNPLFDPGVPPGIPRAGRFRPAEGEGAWSHHTNLLPGRHHVHVMDRAGGWTWSVPGERVIHSNTPFEFEVEVPVVHRTVRVVDGEGRALAKQRVGWAANGLIHSTVDARTDAEGTLRLALPADTYRFVRLPEDHLPARGLPSEARRNAAPVRFEAGDGVLEVVLGD